MSTFRVLDIDEDVATVTTVDNTVELISTSVDEDDDYSTEVLLIFGASKARDLGYALLKCAAEAGASGLTPSGFQPYTGAPTAAINHHEHTHVPFQEPTP